MGVIKPWTMVLKEKIVLTDCKNLFGSQMAISLRDPFGEPFLKDQGDGPNDGPFEKGKAQKMVDCIHRLEKLSPW